MAITVYSEQQILDQTLGNFRSAFPDKDLSTEGFLGLNARAIAQSLLLNQAAILRADWDSPPAYQQDADGTRRSRTSSEALDQWAFSFGLPSDVQGIYGRRGAQAATGGKGLPTGVVATVFPAGSQLSDSTGQVIVQLNASFTVTSPAGAPANFTAVTKGIASNLPVGTVLTWLSPPVGANPTVTLLAELKGGKDRESDIELLDRLLFRIQNPPKGGTAADYRFWAENAFDSTGGAINIARAYVFPLRNGLGTVDVMPLLAGSGLSRDPGDPAIATTIAGQVLAYLRTVRPVTATVRVIRPFMAGGALRVRVRLLPNGPKYNFDWNDNGVGTSIVSATTTTIVVASADLVVTIPSFKAAFDAGGKPRIQIVTTAIGATAAPYQRRVINIQANVPAVGQSTLVLESALPVTPASGEFFYAGGPVVDEVASNIQAFVDSLGPSRQSGYADEFDPWEYKVSIARLADVVLDSIDTDGTRMISNIPNLATNGIQIAFGAGAYSSNDYEPKDVAGGCGLAILQAGGIIITAK